MNHSCCPNAKAYKRDEVIYISSSRFAHFSHQIASQQSDKTIELPLQDTDGNAVIIALEPIKKDDEVLSC